MENKNTNEKKRHTRAGGVTLFGNLRVMAISAMLAAVSVVLGRYAINISDSIRISFENLPVLMSGLFFGPVVGTTVGAVADIVRCFNMGYAINPFITLGAALIGTVSGVFGMYAFRKTASWKGTPRIFIPVLLAHIVGSMCIKSIGMVLYYGTPWETILLRVPIYIINSILEGYLIMLLFKNKTFVSQLNRIINKN